MGLSLVAFDTDHIKSYVFGTDRLKEIRGASSRLDSLNRKTMVDEANRYKARKIYANGGSGLFVVDSDQAEEFVQSVKRAYTRQTSGGASITAVVQSLPPNVLEDDEHLMRYDLSHELELMRYQLREAKGCPADLITLPSHPFMRPCDACGVLYASKEDHANGEPDTFYCTSCQEKRIEDDKVKDDISVRKRDTKAYLWPRILSFLSEAEYAFPPASEKQPERPNDFNEFSQFAEAKHYLGLIYADGNSMGVKVDKWDTLRQIQKNANRIDVAIHKAMSAAIKAHLPYVEIKRDEETGAPIPVFPFDILLLGGDDIVMVTDAAKALDVALTIAQEFRRLMQIPDGDIQDDNYSVSIGVVLAPVKYPFGLLLEMAESTLKFAKKKGYQDEVDASRINFLTVTGGSEPDFNAIYQNMYHKVDEDKKLEFYATLRSYKPDDLQKLLKIIRDGHTLNLGRTKLHQMREAILQMNATTAVRDGLAVLTNWRDKQRSFVMRQVYEAGRDHLKTYTDLSDPIRGFPHVTFPWFIDEKKSKEGSDVYRTSLLDFIELYDFISRVEGGGSDN